MLTGRRNFLRAAGGGLFFCGCGAGLFGQAQRSQTQSASRRREIVIGGKRVRTIDMHAHIYVHDVWPLIKDRKEVDPTLADLANGPMALDKKTVDDRLREMDRQGVDVHVLSVHPGQLHYWTEPELSAKVIQIQNEKLAEMIASHPDRFMGLANVSLAHPTLVAEQMDHAVTRLGMRGFILGGNVNGDELTNPRFEPFWKKAGELGTMVFLHPAAAFSQGANPQASRYAGSGYLVNTIGNPLETTIALSHMIFEGFLDRFPNLRILAAHGGGYLSSYIGRSDNCNVVRADCQKMKRKPSDYLKGPQLFFDALVYSPENIRHLVATTGVSQIVVGSDFAFDVASKAPIDAVLQTPGLTAHQRIAILSGNAEKLLAPKRA